MIRMAFETPKILEARGRATARALSNPTPLPKRLSFQPTAPLRSLKDEVMEVIRPWRFRQDKPPYTAGQLIVMILVLQDLKPQTIQSIHYNILRSFGYYADEAFLLFSWEINEQEGKYQHVAHGTTESALDSSYDGPIEHSIPAFYEAVRDFDIPLIRTQTLDNGTMLADYKAEFTISAAAARVYLRDILEPPRKGTFDFMALPPELREKIYKMLLVYSKPGLILDNQIRHQWQSQFGVQSRDDAAAGLSAEGTSQVLPNINVEVKDLKRTLKILKVSKQIRHEALPVFYGHNTLQFGSLKYLCRTLCTLTNEAILQVGDLRVVLDNYKGHGVMNSLRPLNGLVSGLSPKKLVLIAPRDSWFWFICCGDSSEDRSPTAWEMMALDSVEGLSGVLTMAKQAKHLEILGDGFMGEWVRMKLADSGEAHEGDGNGEMQQEVADQHKDVQAEIDGSGGAADMSAA